METSFNPETALIGGISLLTVHLTIMAMLRKKAPKWYFIDEFFDFLNFPLAFLEMLIVQPPWPIYQFSAWQEWTANSIALAALATVAASKIIQGNKDKARAEGREYVEQGQAEVYARAAQLSEEEARMARERLEH